MFRAARETQFAQIHTAFSDVNILIKLDSGEKITALEIFQFASSVLFFTNAVVNVQTAGQIFKQAQQVTILLILQKKRLHRRAWQSCARRSTRRPRCRTSIASSKRTGGSSVSRFHTKMSHRIAEADTMRGDSASLKTLNKVGQ